jgi:hypothetical protein
MLYPAKWSAGRWMTEHKAYESGIRLARNGQPLLLEVTIIGVRAEKCR